ncbi:MAG: aminopeptidase [Xanthomonadales bacterium]|nr:aminopeptidase [Xanthomonadales bacterium]
MNDRSKALLLSALLPAVALLAIVVLSTGCSSLSYYQQAVAGHLSLMRQRQYITELLTDPQTDPALTTQLRLAQEIVHFAETQLLLDADGSYSQLVFTGQTAVSWNVVAAEEFSVEARNWCFPVAGCVPYRGYFKQQQALDFAAQQRTESYDVYVSPATAYSTLGWFDDPLLDTMFQYSTSQLAGILIHELAHQKLYLSGDTAFNESFAEFVESVGVKHWLQQTERQQELQDWSMRRQAEPQFAALLADTRASLRVLYGSGETVKVMREQKQAMLKALQNEYTSLVSEQWQGHDYFYGWLAGDVNNAQLALAESYAGGVCAFAALYQQAGENLAKFYELARQQADLSAAQREAWLNMPCNQGW